MKRKLSLGLALILVFSMLLALTACKDDEGGKESSVEPASEQTSFVDGESGEISGEESGEDSSAVTPDVPAERYDATATPRTGNNAMTPLVISTGTLDGKFSPLFYTSAYDGDIVDLTQIRLLNNDKDGYPVASVNDPSYALSYTQEISGEGENQISTYKFILKNGLTFSDGTPITAKDLLFSIYTLCDPLYDGSTTFYSMNIQGLTEYRTQTTPEINAKYTELAEKIFAAGVESATDGTVSYPAIEGVTAEQQEAFWSYLDEAGAKFAQEIIDFVNSEHSDFISSKFGKYTLDDLAESDSLRTAFGIAAWGFGELLANYAEDAENGTYGFIADGKGAFSDINGTLTSWTYADGALASAEGGLRRVELNPVKNENGEVTGAYTYTAGEGAAAKEVPYAGKTYSLSWTALLKDAFGEVFDLESVELTAADYWKIIFGSYGYDFSDGGINYESAGTALEDFLFPLYILNEGSKEVEGGIPSISGITYGKEICEDGVERDWLQIVINGVEPAAIFKMNVYVVPFGYYTDGYAGELNEFGVALNEPEFMAHLKTKNSKPLGAGPYVFESFADNVVTYTANEKFMLGSPKIANVRYQVIALGAEMDAVRSGTIHYTKPSVSADIVADISNGDGDFAKLAYTLVDNDGYGYIGIQAEAIPEFEVRQAIAHAINVQLIIDEYYGVLASANYRPMSKVQWAYPENPENLYPYDATGETSKELFLKAGYIYDADSNIMKYPAGHEKSSAQVTFKFSLPAENHPAATIFLDAQKVLGKIGVKVDIEPDLTVADKLNTAYASGIQVWAAAWEAGGIDPDMFQIWYSDPEVNQGPPRSGLYYLFENGSEEEKAILTELNALIIAGNETLGSEERKAIYGQALELASEICVEVPTYQRKNLFVYNKNVVDEDTLLNGDDVTPFQGPLEYIWTVELK